MIYFMQPVDGGPVKIGYSADVETRRAQLEHYYGKPLAVLATMEGGRQVEYELHTRFAHLRFGHTEQFRPTGELMAFIGRPLLVGSNPDSVEVMPNTSGLVLAYKADVQMVEAFKEWLDALAEHVGAPVTVTVDMALKAFAEAHKYKPMPKRLAR